MASNKRERELARAKYERQSARRKTKVNKQRRNQRIVAVVVVVALVLASAAWAAWAFWGKDDEDLTALPSSSASPFPSTDVSAAASPAASDASAAPTGEAVPIDCASPGTNRANDMTFTDAPPTADAKGGAWTLATNCGDIVIDLDATKAPATVASIEFLTDKGFYDNTTCHRLTTSGIYVLQCGDPAADGSGGPGYKLPDENLPASGENNYPAGTVAMANAGAGTGGSQFFIVYENTSLPANYTIFGTVSSGLDIVKGVATQGVADGSADGAPAQPVFIEKATITSK